MKTFLAVYTGSPAHMEASGWNKLSEADRKARDTAGFAAWEQWAEKHDAAIVEQGSPLGKTKRIDASGITDVRNNLTGYVVVRAVNHEAAARMFEGHPHFTVFPGEAVEIMECIELPTP